MADVAELRRAAGAKGGWSRAALSSVGQARHGDANVGRVARASDVGLGFCSDRVLGGANGIVGGGLVELTERHARFFQEGADGVCV